MDDSRDEEFDPTSAERREIGRGIVDESGGLAALNLDDLAAELSAVRRRPDHISPPQQLSPPVF